MTINNQYDQMQYQIASPTEPGTMGLLSHISGGASKDAVTFPSESYDTYDSKVTVLGL